MSKHKKIDIKRMSYVGWEDTIASGWGTTSSSGDLPNILQYVKLPPVSDETCSAGINSFLEEYFGTPSPSPVSSPSPSPSGPSVNLESMICAGF